MNHYLRLFIFLSLVFLTMPQANASAQDVQVTDVTYGPNDYTFTNFKILNNQLYALNQGKIYPIGNNGEYLNSLSSSVYRFFTGNNGLYIHHFNDAVTFLDSNGEETFLFSEEGSILELFEMNDFIIYYEVPNGNQDSHYKCFPQNKTIESNLEKFYQGNKKVFYGTKVFYDPKTIYNSSNGQSAIESLNLLTGEINPIISLQGDFIISDFDIDSNKNFLYMLKIFDQDANNQRRKLYRYDINNSTNGVELVRSFPENSFVSFLGINDKEILFFDSGKKKNTIKSYPLKKGTNIIPKFTIFKNNKNRSQLMLGDRGLIFNKDFDKVVAEIIVCKNHQCGNSSQFLYFVLSD